ncbi:MAG: DUF87 domain-containing protein [Lachnospiraceae bacterium]|nr:DUF87 domain-containing protein [Lachnospiraceae bacterium]MBR6152092.1 DUF87 domain-containing protein [Lachnospiraceae bacterium]
MRLIPGKTKVQIELFKGISLWDVLIGGIGVAMILLVLISSLPFKFVFAIVILIVSGMLLFRLDTEPTYVMVLNMIKHFAYFRRYEKVYDDEMILQNSNGTIKEEFIRQYREKARGNIDEDGLEEGFEEKGEYSSEESFAEGEAAREKEEVLLSEKEVIKLENKILKSKKATEQEKDAIWLARANRSAAKKEAKKRGEKLDRFPAPSMGDATVPRKTSVRSAAAKSVNGKEAASNKGTAGTETQKQAKKRPDNSEYGFMEDVMAFTDVKDDYIEYGGKYYGTVIEIDPVEFRFFSEHRRNNSIELGVGRVLRSIHLGFAANIVKLERPIIYDKYLAKERLKLDQLRKSYESGMMSELELQARIDIENDRLKELEGLCTDKQVIAPFYYIVLFESDKKQLELQTRDAMDSLTKGEMTVRRLDTKELAIFLKYTNQLDFNERDIEKYQPEDYAQWAMPQRVNVKVRTVEVNNIVTHNFRVVKYPSWVDDAWLANVLSMPATKVVIKCSPMDRGKAIRTIDRSLQELRGQYNATGVDSKRIELENHIETLGDLLATLQGEGEELLECNVYVTAYDVQSTRLAMGVEKLETMLPEISSMKKSVRRAWQENNFRLNDNFFNQMSAFIGSQVSAYDPEMKNGRGIPSNSLAACYPWIYAHISDEGGFKLGSSDGVPVFIDFFRRDSERVNSNMVIIGKSGSGKSYATKSILSNLASEDAKIFILDPENEYSELAHNLHGKVINVANAQYGRLNPFHIITALDDDEGGSAAGSFATHLQFLEEFYRQILPEIEKDALEYLNNLTERLYTNRGITPETDLSKLRPEDYPIFDDLYDAVLEEFERTENEYIRSMLRTLINYVAKFSTGGRNANIWNGPSTVTTDENFTVFNFQAMLSNRNTTIANAQMLLVLKYIDNEIIKNRDYNSKYGLKRKVVVVIDEAHVFIDSKFPIALDFMFQLAKRIRKYNGMQIVITQNIKDFVGSEEIARKSTAIINACQYSFIFALAPNDMHDLCTLYEKAGGISEVEQEQIIQAPRGQAFTVMSATSRSTFRVEVPKNMVDMFQEREFHSRYFTGTDGAAAWERFIGKSRKAHDANSKENRKAQVIAFQNADQEQKNWVRFEELTEEQGNAYETARSVQKSMPSSKKVSFEELEDDDLGMSDEDMDALIASRMAQRTPKDGDRRSQKEADEAYEAREIHRTREAYETPTIRTAGEKANDTTQVIGELKDVLADFVQAFRQPVAPAPQLQQPVAGPAAQPPVDYSAMVADIRSQVMEQVMQEIRAEGVTFGSSAQGQSESDEDDLFELGLSDETEEDEEALDLEEDSLLDEILEFDTEEDLTEEELKELEAPEDEEEPEELLDEEEDEASEDGEAEEDDFDFDGFFETEAGVSDEDDDNGDGFDIMSLLRSEAKTIADSKKSLPEGDVELDDYAPEGGVADVTLEDLGKIVSMLRKMKRAKG